MSNQTNANNASKNFCSKHSFTIQEATEKLKKMSKNMLNFFNTIPNNDNNPFNDSGIAQAMNRSVGTDVQPGKYFFQINSFSFNHAIMQNFWSSNDEATSNTSQNIDFINNLFLNLGDTTSKENFYKDFANPYCDFIITYLICNLGLNLLNNRPQLVISNLYRFLRGGGTGQSGGTYGSGTFILCEFCNDNFEYLKTQNEDIYKSLAVKTTLRNFCACCYQTINYLPSYFTQNGTSLQLPCVPICNKNETIQAYNGLSPYVNNGYFNNNNTSSPDGQFYKKRECQDQTTCIIDKVQISIFQGNSQIQFNQVCPGCNSQGGCICYIDTTDSTIDSMENGQNPVTFKQTCKTSLCSQEVDGKTIFLACNPNNTSDTGKKPDSDYDHTGKLSKNSSIQNRDTYIFGLKNWLVPILFLGVAIFITISILIVNIKTAKREIYIIDRQKKFEK